MDLFLQYIQTAILVQGLWLIRSLLVKYPEARESNYMMTFHMFIFNFYLVLFTI